MTKSAVVFSGRKGLDFFELRTGVLRIPEVTVRIREAQKLLDDKALTSIDLLNTVSSDDESFFRNIKLKSLLATIVQVGLFDRFIKSQRRPDYLVGNSNGDSALLVCAGQITFKQMVEASQALETLTSSDKSTVLSIAPAPLLTGISLTEYQALEVEPQDNGTYLYRPAREGLMDLRKIVSILHHEDKVTRFVNIGPASSLQATDYKNLGNDEIESLDSIELDPMLGWFWRNMRPQASVLAQ